MNINTFVEVPGFPGIKVNQSGDVVGAIPTMENDGNRWVKSFDGTEYKRARLADLVILTFFGDIPEGQYVIHKGSPIDDRLSNLEFSDTPEAGPAKIATTHTGPVKPPRRNIWN